MAYVNERISEVWIINSSGTGDTESYVANAEEAEVTSIKMIVLDPATGIDGALAGVGEGANIKLVLDELAAAEKAGKLPERLSLDGHSRGAVQNIELANQIYELYGDKIKINMTLTDPVPGPNRGYGDNKICIPPNVDSVIIAYHGNESKPGFKAQDFGTRIIAYDTDKTTITTFSVPQTHTNQYEKPDDQYRCYSAQKIIVENARNVAEGIPPEPNMEADIYSIIEKKIDGKSKMVNAFIRSESIKFDPSEMIGKGSRQGCNFAMVTPINPDLPPAIQEQHIIARQIFTIEPELTVKKSPEHIVQMKQDTPQERKAYKEAMIDYGKNANNRHEITKGEKLAVALHGVTLGLSTLIYDLNDKHRTRSKGFTIGLSIVTLGILPLVERIIKMVEKSNLNTNEKSNLNLEKEPLVPAPPKDKWSLGSIFKNFSSKSENNDLLNDLSPPKMNTSRSRG